MSGTSLSVEPHEVEHGDIIVGLHTPVASILTDGQSWFYGDDRGTFIAKRPSWGKVQVLRGQIVGEGVASYRDVAAVNTVTPFPTPDDCPPHGITRGRGGLFVVTP